MRNDELYHCRVCGLGFDEPPWGEDGKTASFDLCPCCGVEFGYEDATPVAARRYREEWLKNGAVWADPDAKPANFDLARQLEGIPAAFR
jgi:hypothetical protein